MFWEKYLAHPYWLTVTPWLLLSDADGGGGVTQTGVPESDVTELYDLTRCANPWPLGTRCHWHSSSSWEMMMECLLGFGIWFSSSSFSGDKNILQFSAAPLLQDLSLSESLDRSLCLYISLSRCKGIYRISGMAVMVYRCVYNHETRINVW